MNAPGRIETLDALAASAEEEERAQLIAAVAHDVRSPLQVLGLALQTLRLRLQGRDEQELIQAAESAYDEISVITDDLIDSMQSGVSADTPREEGFMLSNLMSDVGRRFRRRAAELRVDFRILPNRIHCVADRRHLQRILDNLVGNALKHSGATRVVVGARLRGCDTLALEVLDNGCGIPTDEQSLIFEERYRGRDAQQRNTRGQGLGLWIVRRFAQALGGSVCVASIAGRGTRFTVQLPTYALRRRPPVARLYSTNRELEGKLVVLLDDDTESLRAMQICLEALGANVFASSDELQFLAQVTNLDAAPDLALVDFNLGANTAARTLKTLLTRFGGSLRAAIVTAYASDPRLNESRGIVPVFEKPLSVADLYGIVALANEFSRQDINTPCR